MAPEPSAALRVTCDPAEVTTVCVRFLKDYAQTAGRDRFVLGLSGGIDSAVSAALAVRAVGRDRVHAILLPSAHTSKADLQDAAAVAAWLGLKTETIDIQPIVDAVKKASPGPEEVPMGNVSARARMILLHLAAARRNALVLGTGNKSEALTGYFTKYGDAGVDVNPLGDLYKTQVRQLAAHLGVPKRVQEKPPSAGLRAGQTDEAELRVTYDVLDRVLLGLELQWAPESIARALGVDVREVARIDRLRASTAHKRRSPPSPKLGLRTVGLDWRQPIQEG